VLEGAWLRETLTVMFFQNHPHLLALVVMIGADGGMCLGLVAALGFGLGSIKDSD
jgi:hypothetical protein